MEWGCVVSMKSTLKIELRTQFRWHKEDGDLTRESLLKNPSIHSRISDASFSQGTGNCLDC